MALDSEETLQEIRVAFFGTGSIAKSHAKSLSAIPGVKITSLCSRTIEKAQAFNAACANGQATCYGDFGQMLSKEPIDALFACVPPGAHTGEVETAAGRGIHLMLEKPIALSMERANSIAAAVKKSGVRCQIGFNIRHTAPSLKLKQMLNDGTAGRPLMMRSRFFVNNRNSAWWRDPNMGGGQLIEQAIHLYDLARYFLGDAQTISALVDNLAHRHQSDYPVDDVSTSNIRFRNGAIASICAANCADPWIGHLDFTVLCENVMAEFRSTDEASFVYHEGKTQEQLAKQGYIPREEIKSTRVPYDSQAQNFIAAIRGTEDLRSSVDDGVEALRLVLLAAESSRLGGAPQALP